jgi:hypothetical protein
METLDGQVEVPEGTVAVEDSVQPVIQTTRNDNKIDSIINAAFDKVEKTPETQTEIKTDDAGRARGPDGKFVAKPAEPSEASEPAEAPPAEAAKAVEAKPATEQPLLPHPRWSDAEKAIFATLPKEAQQWALNREKDAEGLVTRKTQELSEQRKAHEPLLNNVNKWSQYLQQIGLTPHDAWEQMLSAERTLRFGTPQQKQAALANLAQTYGIDPLHSGDASIQVDPQIQQLRYELQTIQQQLDTERRNAQIQERQRAEYEFNALAQAKDANGTVKFPHFERVKQSMIQLVADGLADSWDTAYTKAVRLDDDLYKLTVEDEQRKSLAAAEKARQESVQKAEKAKPVVATNSPLNGRNQPKGIDAHISAVLDRAGIS